MTALNLFVVDDEPDLRRGLRRILLARGHHVRTAESGEEAIQLARQHPPHGILMDIKMSGLNGVEAFRQIRENAPEAFVIFMSGYSDFLDIARDEGAFAVLSKPLDMDQVCDLLDKGMTSRPILIIDDDDDFARSLARVLEASGLRTVTARNADEALRIFEKTPRAVVLLDMKLNGITGLDVLESLQALNASVRVIEMTGCTEMQKLMAEGMRRNAARAFTKPFDLDEIIQAIQEVMLPPL